MRTKFAVRSLFAVMTATLIALSLPTNGAAGEPISHPGVPKGDHFLAAGPRPVILARFSASTKKTTKTEVNLLLLTQERIIYQEKDKTGSYKSLVREAASSKAEPIMSISTSEATNPTVWVLDKKEKRFVGDVLKPAEIKITADPFSKDEENKYLVFLHLQMQTGLDNALKSNNQRRIQLLLDKSARFAKYIEDNDLDRHVGALFARVKTQHDELAQINRERAEAYKKLQDTNKQYAAEMQKRDAFGQGTMNIGTAFLLAGVLTDDPRMAAQGFGAMSRAASNRRIDSIGYQLAREHAKGDYLDKINAIEKRQNDAYNARDLAIKKVEQKLMLPEQESIQELAKEFEKNKDLTSAVGRLNTLAALNRKATPHGNPWLQFEIFYIESQVPFAATEKQKYIAKLFELANKSLDEARNIPPDKIHDMDRTLMIWRAVEYAVRSAGSEFGDERTLRDSFNQKAVFALRLLETTRKYDIIDLDADVRELEMVAMALCGMHDQALDLGAKIAETRATSPLVHYYLAKLYAASTADKNTTFPAAREALTKSFKANPPYNDYPSVANNADLKKMLDAKFVYDYMMPLVKYKIIYPKGRAEIQFTNTSTVNLKDVDVMITTGVGKNARIWDRKRLESLGPNQMRPWNDFRSIPGLVRDWVIVTPRTDIRLEKDN
jgi:hypothetical protein